MNKINLNTKKLEVIVFMMEVLQMYCYMKVKNSDKKLVSSMVDLVILLLDKYSLNKKEDKIFVEQFEYCLGNMNNFLPRNIYSSNSSKQDKMLNIFINTKKMLEDEQETLNDISFDFIMRTVAIISELYLQSIKSAKDKIVKFEEEDISGYYGKAIEYLSTKDYSIHAKADYIEGVIEEIGAV